VHEGDILVGKITPKGETELTPRTVHGHESARARTRGRVTAWREKRERPYGRSRLSSSYSYVPYAHPLRVSFVLCLTQEKHPPRAHHKHRSRKKRRHHSDRT
jgi:hypothetical protein